MRPPTRGWTRSCRSTPPDAPSAPLDAALPLPCPPGFVLVHGNVAIRDRELCIAKYEMVDVGGVPTSAPTGTAYAYLNPAEGEVACALLGPDYRLVTNEDWQLVARDVEAVSENWKGYAVGVDGINTGNLRVAVGEASDDDHPCDTPGFTTDFPACQDHASEDFWFKRTHRLGSGELVWDLGGNRTEWVTGSHPEAPRVNICSLTGADQLTFGPAGDYSAGCDVGTPTFYSLRGMGIVEGAGGLRVLRGGSYGLAPDQVHEGVFYANTNPFWDTDHPGIFGLRCVYDPAGGVRIPLSLLPVRTTLATRASHALRIRGAVGSYSLSVVVNGSGGTLVGETWTAGPSPGEDVLAVTDSRGMAMSRFLVVPPP